MPKTTTNLSLSEPYRKYYKSIIESSLPKPQGEDNRPITDQFGFNDVPYELAGKQFRKIPESAFDRKSENRSSLEFSYRVPASRAVSDVSTNELVSVNQRLADFILGMPTTNEELVDIIWYHYLLNPKLKPSEFEDKFFSKVEADNNLIISSIIDSYRVVFGDDEDMQTIRTALKNDAKMSSTLLGASVAKGSQQTSIKEAIGGMLDVINRLGNGNATVSSTYLDLKRLYTLVSTPVKTNYTRTDDPGMDLRSFIHQILLSYVPEGGGAPTHLLADIANRSIFMRSVDKIGDVDTLKEAIVKLESYITSLSPSIAQQGTLLAKEPAIKAEMLAILNSATNKKEMIQLIQKYKYWIYVHIHLAILKMKSEYYSQYKYVRIEEQKNSGADNFVGKTTTFDQFQISLKSNDVAIMMDGHEKPVIQNIGGSSNSIVLSIITNDMQILDALIELSVDANLFRRQENMLFNAYSIKARGASGAEERFAKNFDNYVREIVSKASGYDPNKVFDEPILINSSMTQIARIYGCTIDRMEIANVDTAVNTWRITMYLSGMDLSQKDREVLKKTMFTASTYEHDLMLSEYYSPAGVMKTELDYNGSTPRDNEFKVAAEDSTIHISKLRVMSSMSINAIVEDLLFMIIIAYPYLKDRLLQGPISQQAVIDNLFGKAVEKQISSKTDDVSLKLANASTYLDSYGKATMVFGTATLITTAITGVGAVAGAAIAISGALATGLGYVFSKFSPEWSTQKFLEVNLKDMREVLSIFDMAITILMGTYYKHTIDMNHNFSLSMDDLLGFLNVYAKNDKAPNGISLNISASVTDNPYGTQKYRGFTDETRGWLETHFRVLDDSSTSRIFLYETIAHIFQRFSRLLGQPLDTATFGVTNYAIRFHRSDITNIVNQFMTALNAGGPRLIGEMLFHLLSFTFPGKDQKELDAIGSNDIKSATSKRGRTEDNGHSFIKRLSPATADASPKIVQISKKAVDLYQQIVVAPTLDNPINYNLVRRIDASTNKEQLYNGVNIEDGKEILGENVTSKVNEVRQRFMNELLFDSAGAILVTTDGTTKEVAPTPITVTATVANRKEESDKIETVNSLWSYTEINKMMRMINRVEGGGGEYDAQTTKDRYKLIHYSAHYNDADAGASSGFVHRTPGAYRNMVIDGNNFIAKGVQTFATSYIQERVFLSRGTSEQRVALDERIIAGLGSNIAPVSPETTGPRFRMGYSELITPATWNGAWYPKNGLIPAYKRGFDGGRWPFRMGWEIFTALCPYMLITKSTHISSTTIGGFFTGTTVYKPSSVDAEWTANLNASVKYLGTVRKVANTGDVEHPAFAALSKHLDMPKKLTLPGFSFDLQQVGSSIQLKSVNVELQNNLFGDQTSKDTYVRSSLVPYNNADPSIYNLAPDVDIGNDKMAAFRFNTLAITQATNNPNYITDYLYIVIYQSGSTTDVQYFIPVLSFLGIAANFIGRNMGMIFMKMETTNSFTNISVLENNYIIGNQPTYDAYRNKVRLQDPAGTTVVRNVLTNAIPGTATSILLPIGEGWPVSVSWMAIVFTRLTSFCGNQFGVDQGPDTLALFGRKNDPIFDRYISQQCHVGGFNNTPPNAFFAGKVVNNQIENRKTGNDSREIIKSLMTASKPGVSDPSQYYITETMYSIFNDTTRGALTADANRLLRFQDPSNPPANTWMALVTGALSPLLVYAMAARKVRTGIYAEYATFTLSRDITDASGLATLYKANGDIISKGIGSQKFPIPGVTYTKPSESNAYGIMNHRYLINNASTDYGDEEIQRARTIFAFGINLYGVITGNAVGAPIAASPALDIIETPKFFVRNGESLFYGNRTVWLTVLSEMYNNYERRQEISTFPEVSEVFMGIKLDFSTAMFLSLEKGISTNLQLFLGSEGKNLWLAPEKAEVTKDWRLTTGGYCTFFSFYSKPESLLHILKMPIPRVGDVDVSSDSGIGSAIRLIPGGIGSAYKEMVDASLATVMAFDKYSSEHFTRFFLPAINTMTGSAEKDSLLRIIGAVYNVVFSRSIVRWKMLSRLHATSMMANDVGDTTTAYPDLPLPAIWKPRSFKSLFANVKDVDFWETAAATYPHLTKVVYEDVKTRYRDGVPYVKRSLVEGIFEEHLQEINYIVSPIFYMENPFEIRERALNDITNFYKNAQEDLDSTDVSELGVEAKKRIAKNKLRQIENEILTEMRNELAARIPGNKAWEIMKDLDLNLGTLAAISSLTGRMELQEYNQYLDLVSKGGEFADGKTPVTKEQVTAAEKKLGLYDEAVKKLTAE